MGKRVRRATARSKDPSRIATSPTLEAPRLLDGRINAGSAVDWGMVDAIRNGRYRGDNVARTRQRWGADLRSRARKPLCMPSLRVHAHKNTIFPYVTNPQLTLASHTGRGDLGQEKRPLK